jgi:DNA-binding NarL/FixJ family response regulator
VLDGSGPSQLAARVGPSLNDDGTGGVQHPECLPKPALACAGEVVAGQGLMPARMASNTRSLPPWRPGRLRLQQPIDEALTPKVTSPAASLALVAEGWTNRQIGQELFITPKSAGVHVSRILAKLRVTGRGEAAAIPHRLGLDK